MKYLPINAALFNVNREKFKKELPKNIQTIFISSHTQKNLDKLKDMIWTELNKPV